MQFYQRWMEGIVGPVEQRKQAMCNVSNVCNQEPRWNLCLALDCSVDNNDNIGQPYSIMVTIGYSICSWDLVLACSALLLHCRRAEVSHLSLSPGRPTIHQASQPCLITFQQHLFRRSNWCSIPPIDGDHFSLSHNNRIQTISCQHLPTLQLTNTFFILVEQNVPVRPWAVSICIHCTPWIWVSTYSRLIDRSHK